MNFTRDSAIEKDVVESSSLFSSVDMQLKLNQLTACGHPASFSITDAHRLDVRSRHGASTVLIFPRRSTISVEKVSGVVEGGEECSEQRDSGVMRPRRSTAQRAT